MHMFVNYIIHDLIHFYSATKFMHSFIHSLMFVVLLYISRDCHLFHITKYSIESHISFIFVNRYLNIRVLLNFKLTIMLPRI